MKPIFGVLSLMVPLVGDGLAAWWVESRAYSTNAPRLSGSDLLTFVCIVFFLALVGLLMAGSARFRRERPPALYLAGYALNGLVIVSPLLFYWLSQVTAPGR